MQQINTTLCLLNRSIKVANLSKRLSNYSSCMSILTTLVGFNFEQTNIDNGKKISLPDEVEVDTLVQFTQYFNAFKSNKASQSDNESSDDMKIMDNHVNTNTFWSCNRCTFHNQISSTACQMCGSPASNVCVPRSITVNIE